jgi:hypothetical protein
VFFRDIESCASQIEKPLYRIEFKCYLKNIFPLFIFIRCHFHFFIIYFDFSYILYFSPLSFICFQQFTQVLYDYGIWILGRRLIYFHIFTLGKSMWSENFSVGLQSVMVRASRQGRDSDGNFSNVKRQPKHIESFT